MTTPSPYPGLRPFQQDEAHLFFGREAQVEDMLARLEDHRFLVVVGTSGCGKSSLVRAGLLPALEQGFLSDAKPNWRMAVMRPGSAPFDNLTAALLDEAALGRERQHASQAAALLQATLRRGPLGLVEAVAESHLSEDTNLLLVVDQFEEIFRYRKQIHNVNDADAFVNLLLASVQSQRSDVPIYVVITMRSDFIGDCALFTGLPEAINDSQFLTPRLTRDQYRAAIVEPALVAGGQLTDALVNQLLNDLRGEPDQLPVLQHALMRMWTQATDNAPARTLTLDDYKKVGGLAGALSQHCDEILNDLSTEQQRIAEVMFRALCKRSSEQRDTRRLVRLGEIAAIAEVTIEAVKPIVDAFRDTGRNFLMPPLPIPLDAETTLDISHESLIRQWQTLNTWVAAETESARQYQRLEDVAKRRQQRGGAELWRGVDLENARNWKERQKPTEAWGARYGDAYQLAMDFLQASEAEEEKQRREYERAQQRELERAKDLAEFQRIRAEEQARAARRFKMTTVAVGVLLLLTIGVAIYAIRQQNRAASAQQQAENAQRESEEKKKEAVHAAEEATRQQGIAEHQRQVAVVRLARYFAAVSKASIETQPTLSILLSIEAIKAASVAGIKAAIPLGEEALRDAITKIASTAMVGHEDVVFGVAFSPDGQGLATTSWDKTVRLWSLSNPSAEPRVLRGHEGTVFSVAFSPDGQGLATASGDKTVRLWSIKIDDLVRIACLLNSSNFSHKEWQQFLGDEPYRKTCQNRPLHPSFLEIVWSQVKSGDVEGAVAKLLTALKIDGASDAVLRKEARRLAAPGLVDKGRELARAGDINNAVDVFKQALEFDPTLTLEPEKEVRRLAASGLVDRGRELAKQGAIQANDPNLEIAAAAWNSLCWFGSLGGFATEVIEACERAVALEPDNGGFYDSRGVARVFTVDYPGAIQDFQRYLEWGPEHNQSKERIRQRQDWIRMLQANQNPFNRELLKLLRDQ
jgi:energy-coupling factor transporter ATP-binding protein EcfA2